MSAATIYNRRKMGMDYRVWLVMLLTCLLTLGLFGYKKISHKTCSSRTVYVNGTELTEASATYTKNKLLFKINAERNATVVWNFNDGTSKIKGLIVSHAFTNEGVYKVQVTVNNTCSYENYITIVAPLAGATTVAPVIDMFVEPKVIVAGKPITFYGVSNIGIHAYKWQFVNAGLQDQYSSTATVAFKKEGSYKVRLTINNNPAFSIVKQVTVAAETHDVPSLPEIFSADNQTGGAGGPIGPPIDMDNEGNRGGNTPNGTPSINTTPVSPDNAPPPAVAVDPNTLKSLLQEVINGEKEIEELYVYLSFKKDTKVEINGKQPTKNLKPAIEEIKEKRHPKIEELEIVKNDRNEIQTLKLKIIERKRWYDKIFQGNR